MTGKLTDEELRAAHVVYVQAGLSLRGIASHLWERAGYASSSSCAQAIMQGFMRLGLPRRDRREAAIAAATKHGRRAGGNMAGYKRWLKEQRGELRPYCAGTRTRDGEPCEQRAMHGSTYCPQHDPARREQLVAHLRRINPHAPAGVTVNGNQGGHSSGSKTRREGDHRRARPLAGTRAGEGTRAPAAA